MSGSDPYASGPQPGDTTYAAYTPSPYQTPPVSAPPFSMSPVSEPPPVRQGGLALPIVSLVCSLLALLLVLVPLVHPLVHVAGIVIAIVGVICGHVALSRPAGSRGRGLAIAALVFGYLAFALGLLKLIGGALFAGLLPRRLGSGLQRGL